VKALLSRIFIRWRELTQLIRKLARKPYNNGRSTAQLGEQSTPNDSGPQTIQLSTPVGWIGTSTCTTQLIGRIGTSTRSTQTTIKDQSTRIWTSIRVSTTLNRRRHEPPHTNPPFSLFKEILLSTFFLDFPFFLPLRKKERR
jgi:hypothetical protein